MSSYYQASQIHPAQSVKMSLLDSLLSTLLFYPIKAEAGDVAEANATAEAKAEAKAEAEAQAERKSFQGLQVRIQKVSHPFFFRGKRGRGFDWKTGDGLLHLYFLVIFHIHSHKNTQTNR